MRTVLVTTEKLTHQMQVRDASDWQGVVDACVALIQPGSIFALKGPLGAGKTTFVQAFAAMLGIEKQLQSPTFALMRSYRLPKPVRGVSRLIHVDAYRIEDENDILPLDLDTELSDGESILCIEWPENVQGWIAKHEHVLIEISGV